MVVPYIGITGIVNRTQVVTINAGAINLMRGSGKQIMIGVLASSKTLAGQSNKYPYLYPPIKNLPEIFASDPRFLNLIHYSTDNPLLLREEIFKIIQLFKERKNGLNGFQLNIPWPSISHLEDIKNAFPKLKFVLQIGPEAFEKAGHSPKKVRDMASDYMPFVDYFLLDKSAGFNKPLDAEALRPYLRELSDLFTIGLGIAGGLGPDTLYLAEPLIQEFPDLSIDALQTNNALNANHSVEYIRQALKMYKKYE